MMPGMGMPPMPPQPMPPPMGGLDPMMMQMLMGGGGMPPMPMDPMAGMMPPMPGGMPPGGGMPPLDPMMMQMLMGGMPPPPPMGLPPMQPPAPPQPQTDPATASVPAEQQGKPSAADMALTDSASDPIKLLQGITEKILQLGKKVNPQVKAILDQAAELTNQGIASMSGFNSIEPSMDPMDSLTGGDEDEGFRALSALVDKIKGGGDEVDVSPNNSFGDEEEEDFSNDQKPKKKKAIGGLMNINNSKGSIQL